MPESLQRLIAVPTLNDLMERQLEGLKGIGWPRHTVGFSVGTVDLDGTPAGDYDLVIRIVATGGLGAGSFEYSLDGGVTFSTTQAIDPTGVFVIPDTGVTITFDDAGEPLTGFQLGDEWRVTLAQNGFPITSWQPFSTPRTLVENDVEALQALFDVVYYLGTGGYVGTAQGAWLDLLAEQTFGERRTGALATVGVVELTDSQNAGPFTVQAGELVVATAAGLKYSNTEAFTLALGEVDLQVEVQAEQVGVAYNAGNGAIAVRVSGQAGITVANPDPGSGTWITRAGRDTETDKQLSQRLMAKWPKNGAGAPNPTYDTWAKTASDSVVKTTTRVDPDTAGVLALYLAGGGGGVPPDVVDTVQTYVNYRAPECIEVDVQSAVNVALVVAGTVYVFSGFEVQAMRYVQEQLAQLVADMPIGGTVYFTEVIERIMSAPGVRNVALSTPSADLVLGTTEVASLTNNLTYSSVQSA